MFLLAHVLADTLIAVAILAVPVAMTAAIVIYGVKDLRRQLRTTAVKRNLCLTCGYDLRSSGPQCPECGTTR